ncbi:MFS transporter [Angustibacter sp. McL0619]|uniref:MFS transporter n=1 Tax=Angustibacter sp. McL0619 TaxID=3415676 RepID=UPI003CEF3336
MPFVADLRTVLRGRDFRRLFAVRLVSQGGDGVFQVALASLIFFSPERATTAVGTAAAFSATVLPYTVIGPFAGVLLDKWRRRQVMVIANLIRVLLVVVVAGMVAAGWVGLPLYLAVLACLSVNRFFLTGLGASLPHVVPRHELVMANAVSPTSGTLAALGLGAVGYLVSTRLPEGDQGDAILLLLSAGVYLVAALLALRIGRDALGPDHGERTAVGWNAVAEGAAHVRERRPAWNALAAIGVHRFAYGISTIATILLCRNHFNDPEDVSAGLALLAQVFIAAGIGFGLAALVTPVATARWGTGGWICRCLLGAGIVQSVLVLVLTVPLMLFAAFSLGIAAQGVKICVDAVVQREVDDEFRGRVFAFYDVVFNVAFVVAAACAALAVPTDGYSPAVYAVVALLYLGAAAGYGRTLRTAAPSQVPADS